jgi:hypothetical protein
MMNSSVEDLASVERYSVSDGVRNANEDKASATKKVLSATHLRPTDRQAYLNITNGNKPPI